MNGNDFYIEIQCLKCGSYMKKSSGTSLLTYYCPKCENKIHIEKIETTIRELL